jgi:hypothetical protein
MELANGLSVYSQDIQNFDGFQNSTDMPDAWPKLFLSHIYRTLLPKKNYFYLAERQRLKEAKDWSWLEIELVFCPITSDYLRRYLLFDLRQFDSDDAFWDNALAGTHLILT